MRPYLSKCRAAGICAVTSASACRHFPHSITSQTNSAFIWPAQPQYAPPPVLRAAAADLDPRLTRRG